MTAVTAFMLATAAAPYAATYDVRNRELLSSIIISGSCARGCQGERRLFGTGEIVAQRNDGRLVVLTARHVIADMAEPHVYVRNGAPEGTPIAAAVHQAGGIAADVIAQSRAADLALVSFRPGPSDAYAIASFAQTAPAKSGNVVGGPNGALWTVSPFRVAGQDGNAIIVSCATCGPGDSGGGVFDAGGALAGILVSQQLYVKPHESPASATRTTRFKIVALDDVLTFVAAQALDAPLPADGARDPWGRFDQPAAHEPWSRFGEGGAGAR